MKLKISLITLIIGLSNLVFGQVWQKNIEGSKDPGQMNYFEIQKAFNNYWEPLGVKNGKYLKNGELVKAPGWKLFKRWEWYWESRIDLSTGEFPTTSTAKEWQKYKASSEFFQLKSASGNWTSMGPVASAGGYAGIGRINCISFHPSDNNTYWVGSPSGGLWKTTDNGVTWTPLTDYNDVLGVSDIAIPSDYATSNTIYIATGDRDGGSVHTLGGGHRGDNNTIGFLKSTNGGSTWTSAGSINIADRRLSGFLRIHPENDQILFAGIDNYVYKSIDGANTWGFLLYTAKDYVIDMEFNPSNPDIIYVATKASDSAQIIRTMDGGTNWTIQHTFDADDRRIELAVSPADPAVVYAAVANSDGGLSGIYKSTDNGDNFTEVFDGDAADQDHSLFGYYSDGSGDNTGQGRYDLALAVAPTDENLVFLGGINTWKSLDGGVTWIINNMWTDHSNYNKSGAPEVHADKHVLKFQNATTLFEGNDGGIYKTTDGGNTWADLTNGMTISQIYRLGVSATSPNTVITGLQDNGSKLTHEGNWSDVTGGDGMECLIDYTDHNIQYGTYINGEISRTTDLWNTSVDIFENIGDGAMEGHWVTPYIIDPVDHNTIYVGYQDVWKSTDKGDTFEKISTMNTPNNLRSMAISPSNNQVMYVANQSTLWTTKDGGANWTDVTGSLPNRITYIAVHAYDPNTVWTTHGGYTGNHVYESTDGGLSWTNISDGLPSLPVFSIIQNKMAFNKNHLYVGTDRGVYFKDGDANWALFNSGLPNVMVTELDIHYNNSDANNSILYAATYGRGLWTSDLKEVPVPTVDAGILEIVEPTNKTYCGASTISPTVKIKNNGSSNLTSFTLTYNLDGGNSVAFPWTGNLIPGGIETLTFSEILPSDGSYTFNVVLSNVNGGADEVSFNDTKSVSFTVVNGDFGFPYAEGFNSENIPGCWTQQVVTSAGSVPPELSFVTSSSDPAQVPSEGTHMIKFNSNDSDPGNQIRLMSPPFSSINQSQISVNFKWNESAVYSNKDSVTVQWSTDGMVWNNVETFLRFNESSPGWVAKSTTLPDGAENQSEFYIAFLFTSEYGINCYLDDLTVTTNSAATESITTGVISGSPFTVTELSGATVSVPFTSVGTYSANEYTAYLSDASGSFVSETAIGLLTSDENSATIQANIPAATTAGTSYKIRVKSSNPVVVGSESNAFEIINATSSITIGSIFGSPFTVSPSQGSVVEIPFAISGVFSTNTFTAFLSDKDGNFANETEIGNLVSDANGEIFGLIALNTASGTAYKIRIKSSNPALTSNESNALEVILDDVRPTVSLSASVENPTNVSPITVSVEFSEAVTDFDLSKITEANSTKDNFIILGNSSFTFELSPISDGVVSAEILEGVVIDAVGNTNIASTQWTTTYIQALGIEDFTNEGILIYPNPVNHHLNIEFGKTYKKLNIKLISVEGKLQYQADLLNASNHQIEVSDLAKGIYFIQLNIEGKLLNARILKQ